MTSTPRKMHPLHYGREQSRPQSTRIGERLGHYRIEEKISEGGMGAVYRAEQLEPIRRRVALKVIKGNVDSDELHKRFSAERQALAMMDHPGIATIFDGGTTEDGSPYFVMELIEGQPFARYCDEASLGLLDRLHLFVKVCRAVQHAHDKGVIHRDLKPSNVLVTKQDSQSLPKVIDFGLAKATSNDGRIGPADLTVDGYVMGTFQYMSPEQAAGDKLDQRTDVYSLGTMLYEVLTGSTPIESVSLEGQPFLKVLEMVREFEPPRPSDRVRQSSKRIRKGDSSWHASNSSLQTQLAAELDWVVMQALEKSPDRRYPTVAALADDVGRYLDRLPVEARPPSQFYNFRKFIQRNRGRVATVGILAVATIAAIVAVPVFMDFQTRAEIATIQRSIREVSVDDELGVETWQSRLGLIAELDELDTVKSAEARRELANQTLAAVERQLQLPRLSQSQRDIAEAALKRVESLPVSAEVLTRIDALKQRFQATRGDWRFVVAADRNEIAKLEALFAASEIRAADAGGICMLKEWSPADNKGVDTLRYESESHPLAPSTLSTVACAGECRLEVVFEQWQDSHEAGITLYEVDSQGYDFIVRTPRRSLLSYRQGVGEEASFPTLKQAIDQTNTILVEIRRGDLPLMRHEIDARRLLGIPLQMQARREGNQLTVTVNGETFQMIDPFPFRTTEEGQVAVRCSGATRLTSLRCDMRTPPVSATQMSVGDSEFRANKYLAAFEAYKLQGTSVGLDRQSQLEAKYKSGICLLRLERTREGEELLAEVVASPHATWAPLAAIALWDQAAQSGDSVAQDQWFRVIESLGALEQLVAIIPEDTRRRIVDVNLAPSGMIELLKPETGRLARVQRAAELDRVLSYDSRGSVAGQFELSRVLRAEGELEAASAVLSDLCERSSQVLVRRAHARVLRLLGRTDEAAAFIRSCMGRSTTDDTWLLISLAQVHAANADYELAQDAITQAMQLGSPFPSERAHQLGQLYLMQGFLHERKGRHADALLAWKTGHQSNRTGVEQYKSSNHSSIITGLILGGLSGQLDKGDTSQFFDTFMSEAGGSGIRPLLQTYATPDRTHDIFSEMWKTETGMDWAERIAFESVSLRDRAWGPAIVAGAGFFGQSAFVGQLSHTESLAVHKCIEAALQAWAVEGRLSNFQLMQIGMSWKGLSLTGNASLPSGLEPNLAARLGYLFGNKRLVSGKIDEAKKFFDGVANVEGADATIKTLATEASALTSLGQGQVRLLNSSASPVTVALRDSHDAIVFEEEVGESTILRLAPGKYSVECELLEPNRPLTISLGRTAELDLYQQWAPSKYPSTLYGLVDKPTRLSAYDQWQIVRTHGAAKFADISWNADGSELAVTADDNVIRIVGGSDLQQTRILATLPSRVRSLDWSPDGKILAAGCVSGAIVLLDPLTGQKLGGVREGEYPTRIIRWDPSGTRLAFSASATIGWIHYPEMQVVEFSGTGNQVHNIAWSRDGQHLATASTTEAIVWNLQSKEPSQVFDGFSTIVWSDDATQLVVGNRDSLALKDSRTGRTLHTVTLDAGIQLSDAYWEPGANSVLVTGYAQGVYRWRLNEPSKTLLSPSPVFGGTVIRPRPRSDGFALGCGGGCMFVDQALVASHTVYPGKAIFAISHSTSWDSKRVAVVSENWGHTFNRLQVVSTQDASVLTKRSEQPWLGVSWHPTLDRVAAVDSGGRLWIGDEQLSDLAECDIPAVEARRLFWNAAGTAVYVGSADGQLVRCGCTFSGDSLQPTLGQPEIVFQHQSAATSFDVSADEKLLAVVDSSNNAWVFLLKTGEQKFTLPMTHRGMFIRFSPSGKRLASGNWDRVVTWRMANGKPLIFSIPGRLPEDAAWYSDEVLACPGSLGEVHEFDLSTGKQQEVYSVGEALKTLTCAASQQYVLVSDGGIVRQVDRETGQLRFVAVLTHDEQVACFSAGGGLLTPLDSLTGLSCLVQQGDEASVVSAAEFFETINTINASK